MKTSIFTVTALSLACASVFAQETRQADKFVPGLETIVVVSSRHETPLREVATSVAVLEEAQIDALGFTALADVLRTLPSVSVSNSGGMGKTSSLRVRGEAGYRTMVQIDGVDISDPTGTQSGVQIQHILSSDVGRVELLRGPQGLMYGADAGGVLNISTRHTEDGTLAKLSGEAGSLNTQSGSASIGGSNGQWDYFASVARAKTDGFNTSQRDTVLRDDDGYANTTAHGRIGVNLTENLRVEAVARNTDATFEFDRCGSPAVDDCTGTYQQSVGRLSASHSTDTFDNTLAYGKTDITRRNFTAGVKAYDTEGDIEKTEWLGKAKLSDAHALAYGLEYRTDTVLDMERDQKAAYLEYQGRYNDRFFVTVGGRHDDNDDFGTFNSYRVSGAYVVDVTAGEVKLKTSYGTGFRAPSLYEIDYNRQQNNPTLAALEPEESEGLDLGVEYFGSNGVHLEAVLFKQSIEREIAYDLVGWTGYLQAAGENRSRGIELIANLPIIDQLVLNLNYTYTDTETAAGSPRARQPKHMANLGLTWLPVSKVQVSMNLRSASDTQDTNGKDLDDYKVLDASVRYAVTPMLTVYGRGENLTDKKYVEVAGYNTARAAGYAGVEVRF